MEEKKNLEVVSGDGSNLDISPAYDHLNVETPKRTSEKPKNIVIPKVKSKKSNDDDNNDKDKNNDISKKVEQKEN